jgi:hypothetical protein
MHHTFRILVVLREQLVIATLEMEQMTAQCSHEFRKQEFKLLEIYENSGTPTETTCILSNFQVTVL